MSGKIGKKKIFQWFRRRDTTSNYIYSLKEHTNKQTNATIPLELKVLLFRRYNVVYNIPCLK